MTGFDSRTCCLYRRVELSSRKTGYPLRANVVSRVKNAFANAFSVPALASAVA